jgi:hypothetical protein
MVKRCPICHFKLDEPRVIFIGELKYLYNRCKICYYEEKNLITNDIKRVEKKRVILF